MRYPNAIWMPTAQMDMGRFGFIPSWICYHGTAGGSDAEAIGRWFLTQQKRSPHFIVGTDGKIVQMVDTADTAWCNGNNPLDAGFTPAYLATNASEKTITIECCKPDINNNSDLTEPQYQSLVTLTKWIVSNHAIPVTAGDEHGGFIGHNFISPKSKPLCPGSFPMSRLIRDVRGLSMQGWTDSGGVITAPNGIQVIHGFADYLRNNPVIWAFLGLPLRHEYRSTKYEAQQEFENGGLAWNDNKAWPLAIMDYYHIDTTRYTTALTQIKSIAEGAIS